MFIRRLALTAAISLAATAAQSDCSFTNETDVTMLSAEFEAWVAVTDAMAACGNFSPDLDPDFRTRQPEAFAAQPARYQLGGVSNGTITPLLDAGTIRPLDDLIAEYGAGLTPNQLIQIDGETMAVAMMVNVQHLMYRADILTDLGLDVPTTWEEVLDAAATIREAGVVDHPIGATMASGWDLAQEFVNMFIGFGGTFFNDDNTPDVDSEAGLAALDMMIRLTDYMAPDYLNADAAHVQQQLQQGRIAMANLWASRGGALDDPAESEVAGLIGSAAAPMAMAGSAPATTLWWDGIVVAANIPDDDAANAFRLAMEGLAPATVDAAPDAAIWLIPGYQPTAMSAGAIASAIANPAPPSYPSTTRMDLMHTALGAELPGFFTGDIPAEAALAAVESAYTVAARTAGLLP